jgi:DNA-binding MarR family transcriptional regulator
MNNNLERLIKQKVPFASPLVKAQLGVLYLAYNFSSTQQQNLKKYNITLQQYNILRILRGQYPQPANISLLRERMLDKMSDTSRLVNRLCKLGLVSKRANLLDKRNADVFITEDALLCLEEIDQKGTINQTLFDCLTPEEVETFNDIVNKLLATL